LRLVHLKHTIVHPKVSEEDHADDDPARHVLSLSRLKARSVCSGFHGGYILGADTIVVLDGCILGKPTSKADARDMLGRLSGRQHDVYTGITLIDAASETEVQGYERTQVTIRRMTPEEIDAYIETGEPMDKAGSYGIQGYGAAIVEKVIGCYFNVVGLPLVRLLYLMRDLDKKCGGG
jgi:septum formation protein